MFERKPLRDDIQHEIIARLWDGRLPPAERINETRLATALGVSRTPLREAMIYLAAAGFLDSDLGRGFKTLPLDATEFRQIQAVLQILVPAALTGLAPLAPEQLMELNNLLGRARLQGNSGAGCARLEHGFLTVVARASTNRLLTADLLRLAGLARRYWQAVGGAIGAADQAASLAGVYEALRGRRYDEAAALWRTHHEGFTALIAALL